MRHPPRLSHLATTRVLVARLAPLYARAHAVDETEAALRVERALQGVLRDELLDACWAALQPRGKRPNEAAVLERVAASVTARGLRPGRVPELNPAWSAFVVRLDLEAGIAGESARRVFETERGRQMAEAGLSEAGSYLAAELTRK